MSRVFSIAFCLSLISLVGCNGGRQQSKPIWEDVKLADLAPAPGSQKPSLKISAANIQIHVFEIPAENTEKLDEISKLLSLQPFRFNQYSSFTANGFATGFGRISSGDRILELLDAAGGKKTTSISLLLEDGRIDYVPITRLFTAKNIFYTSSEGTTDSKSIGPGQLCLRITAKKNLIFRGTYTIIAVPAIPVAFAMPGTSIQDAAKSDDTAFDSCSFNFQFSAGDFIFLRPVKYSGQGSSLGSLFFSRPGIKPVVLTFLIVCTDVIE